ncbi:MAG: CIA30 family protein [Chloroflexota bacterium]
MHKMRLLGTLTLLVCFFTLVFQYPHLTASQSQNTVCAAYTVDDFETEGDNRGAYSDASSEVAFERVPSDRGGEFAGKVDYTIATDGFGGFGLSFDGSQDWSDYEVLSFWFRGENTGTTIRLMIDDNRSNTAIDTSERFEYTFTDDSTDWQQIELPWSAFERSQTFQPSGAPDDGLTLTEMWGLSLAPVSGSGSFMMDDIMLLPNLHCVMLPIVMINAQSTTPGPQPSATLEPTQTATPEPAPTATPVVDLPPAPQPPSTGAYSTNTYRNLFKEYGYSDTAIQAKVDTAFQQLFYGDDENQRVYYPVGDDMAYIWDVGSNDVRSEGQSYGMMIAVQLDKQEEFDRIWKWTKTYLQHQDGPREGYFAWQATTDGEKISQNNASDGEIWLVTALFFASGRWGDGEGIYNYRAEAQAILDAMRSKEATAETTGVYDIFDPENKLVRFVAEDLTLDMTNWTDPSYHQPGFYDLWALWADKDNQFWADAAVASRNFLQTTVHPTTGLMPDYANFDGTPHYCCPTGEGNHHFYGYDARRTQMNIAMDYHWWAKDPWQKTQTDRLQAFFYSEGVTTHGAEYELDGRIISDYHQSGHVAMNTAAGLAGTTTNVWAFADHLWNVPIPDGQWRYYDGLLYMLGLLHTSGNFRIYEPEIDNASPEAVQPLLECVMEIDKDVDNKHPVWTVIDQTTTALRHSQRCE